MKYNHDRLMQAKRTVAMVRACTISVDHAIQVVQSMIGGTVFDIRLKEVDQHLVWRVKLLRDRERVKVYVHANTGHILEAKAEIAIMKPHSEMTPDDLIPSCQSPSLSN